MRRIDVVAGMTLLAACGKDDQVHRDPSREPPLEVAAVTVAAPVGAEGYRAAGTVRASRRAELATRMMARVEAIRVKAGDRVRAGQVLVTLERGAVTAAGSQAGAGLELATSHFRRMERLYADSAVPLAQVEAARSAYQQAKGQVDAANTELGYASLSAPFDGVVVARYVDPGDLAAPGQPMLVVEDAGAREIVVGAPESVAAGVTIGATITVLVGAGETPIAARVAAVVPSADPLTRTREIRLTTTAAVTPGLSAVAELPIPGRSVGEPSVPKGAIVERGELTGVFLVTADSTARLRWIRLGAERGAEVIVASGLVVGDVVLTNPARVHDGERVRPVITREAAR